MKISSKKAQISNLAPAIIMLVIAAFFLVMGLIIMQSINDTPLLTRATTISVDNFTINPLNDSEQKLTGFGDRGANSFTAVYVTNGTGGGEIVAAVNYTLSGAGTIRTASTVDASTNGSQINVSYTYARGQEAWQSANQSIIGLATFADFWEIIVLAIVIGIVIGLLLIAFGGSRRNR